MELVEVLILVISFIVLLAMGVPIAYSIGISSVLAMLASIPAMPATTTVAQRMATGLDSFALLAIPFFILAGQLMNRGGIARRLIDFAKSVVGVLPGGLAHVNILAAMLFGSISGSAAAAATAVGGVMTPHMDEEGYDRGFGAAVNITSATTGLIIPPSNILIVYSLASGGVSIAALFLAGYLPGILVGLSLMVVAGVIAHRRRYPRAERLLVSVAATRFIRALPSLFMLVVVIGGIVAGVFTATEASAVAVMYAFLLAMIYREIKLRDLPDILLEFGADAIAAVSTEAGVFQLLDADKEVLAIKGVDNLRAGLEAQLEAGSEARFFVYEEAALYTSRESQMIQAYLQQYGKMPGGGSDELDDLF